MQRRHLLATGGAILGGLPVIGCSSTPPNGPMAPKGTALVDIHCHLFNSSDLPTVRFIKIVVLEHYPKDAIKTLDIDDPDALDGLIALFTWIVGRTRAPSAKDEVKVLAGKRAERVNADDKANEAAVIDAIANFAVSDSMGVSDDPQSRGIRKVRRALLTAAGASSLSVSNAPMSEDGAKLVAERAYKSKFDLGLLLRWFALFTRYRYVLTEKLAADHVRQGFMPLLLCPAIVDYDNWLGEHVEKSPIPSQVEVMARVALRRKGPAVHGYVGFDPLRQVLFDKGISQDYNPLQVVDDAIRLHGFVGVKLYPPMGFRAFENEQATCQTYPDIKSFQELLNGQPNDPSTSTCSPRPADGSRYVGRLLDGAMARLFDLCVKQSGSVIAHANDSNSSGKDYSKRADPAFWLPVFKKWPTLNVCLAHFGHFASVSDPSKGKPLPESSWEWTLGGHLKANPAAPVFADISYLTEIFGRSDVDLETYTATLKRWVKEFDPDCQHLMFGTDWTMLGLDKSYTTFSGSVHEYFRTKVFAYGDGKDDQRLKRLFSGNAARFLSLRADDPGRKRLEAFYTRNGLPASRLPLLE